MNRVLRDLVELFSSLKLTLFCLAMMMVLVFVGTLDQVHLGTFAAQKKYFDSFWIFLDLPNGWKLPVFPGGLTVGGLWLANLLVAHAVRFRLNWKKSGIFLAHAGLVLLLLGQFCTQLLSRESQMAVAEGTTRNYSESPRDVELAVVSSAGPDQDEVVSVPWSRFNKDGRVIEPPGLPFRLTVKKYYPNARLEMAPPGVGFSPPADQGVGSRVAVREIPATSADDESNNVTAYVEVSAGGRSLGTWLLSTALGAPQSVSVDGREYRLFIRPKRYYYPFRVTLKDFRHDRYAGTDIPKNFSSLIRLTHPEKGEDRDVLIYTNHPLRYEGKTFYQASFAEDDTVSIFQVVENPARITPYAACALVALGLAVQFLLHLVSFARRTV